jgi:hypothetical protein
MGTILSKQWEGPGRMTFVSRRSGREFPRMEITVAKKYSRAPKRAENSE